MIKKTLLGSCFLPTSRSPGRSRFHDHCLEENTIRSQKKFKTDESDIRQQCRVKCGADVIIQHVLLFIVSAEDEE
jgi:hypothetical protein